jgi:hypothetical protein
MNQRATRYHIEIIRRDGTAETIQANSRRVDAIKRARFVAADVTGWPSVWRCYVIDTMAYGSRIAAQFNR